MRHFLCGSTRIAHEKSQEGLKGGNGFFHVRWVLPVVGSKAIIDHTKLVRLQACGEGEIALGVEEEDSLPAEPQVETVDTPPADAAPPRPVDEPEATNTRAVQGTPTEKQQACPHPVAEIITLTGGITICNHCFGLVAFDPLADAA